MNFKSPAFKLACLSTFIGSVTSIVYKYLMVSGISPISIGLVEALTIIFFLIPFVKWKETKRLAPRKKIFVTVGALLQGLGTFFSYLALDRLDPITFSFLGRNQVTISILLGYFFLAERHSLYVWVFLIFSLIGSMLLCYSDLSGSSGLGIALTLMACFAYSLRSYVMKLYSGVSTLSEIFYGYLVTMALIFAAIYFKRAKEIEILNYFPSLYAILIIVATAIFSVLGSSYFYLKALNYGKLSLVSSIRLFSPYLVALYSQFFYRYEFKMTNIYGLILMSLAILIFIMGKFGVFHTSQKTKEQVV